MENDVIQTGLIRLRDLVGILKERATFTDEEGEFTTDLEALVDALAQPVAWMWELLPESPINKHRGEKSGVYLENPATVGIDISSAAQRANYKWTPLYALPQPAAQALENAKLGSALQRAAKDLPDGWSIAVELERGAGWVEMHDDYGGSVVLEEGHESLADQVNNAIDIAIRTPKSA